MSTTDDQAARTTPTERLLAPPDRRQRLVGFLVARLTEDLTLLWNRDGPGMAAQVGVLDDLLTVLRGGALPERRELRVLLFGYGSHPDYDPCWTELLTDG